MTRLEELDRMIEQQDREQFERGARWAVKLIAEYWDARLGPKQDGRVEFFAFLRRRFKFNAKRCRICKQWKPLDDYPVAKHCRDGHYSFCRKCEAKKDKARRDANPEACRQYSRDFYWRTDRERRMAKRRLA